MNPQDLAYLQETQTYEDLGFDNMMNSQALNQESETFFSEDDINVLVSGLSASKTSSGLQQSPAGILSIDWDNGVINIKFPGDVGFMKIGFVGTDNDGNSAFGILLNDGVTNRGFLGIKAQ